MKNQTWQDYQAKQLLKYKFKKFHEEINSLFYATLLIIIALLVIVVSICDKIVGYN